MNAKKRNTSDSWVDPDDAPELTDEMLTRATLRIGGREVSIEEFKAAAKKALRGRPRAADPRRLVSIRLPESVLARWKATGPGWQTRMAQRLSME